MMGVGEDEGRPERRSRRSAGIFSATPGAGWRTEVSVVGRNRPGRDLRAQKGSMVFCGAPQLWVAEGIFSETCWFIGKKGRGLSQPKSMYNLGGARCACRR